MSWLSRFRRRSDPRPASIPYRGEYVRFGAIVRRPVDPRVACPFAPHRGISWTELARTHPGFMRRLLGKDGPAMDPRTYRAIEEVLDAERLRTLRHHLAEVGHG